MMEKTKGYKVRSFDSSPDDIREVEVERWSESSVWVNGRRCGRVTSYESYYPTREEAMKILRDKIVRALNSKKELLASLPDKITRLERDLQEFDEAASKF